ncbi:hypothetical protein [uncultured Tenacibaculum sp.]|uniref:hypothetical protein n=1 Tax=uncultured Tenacibaculum sp. TaxID=174713 RepID=UPI00261AF826|nr:hypothetical protein [uncultured Tenacibaculum sp.]
MKKFLFFIAVVIFASCNSNDETLKVNEQPREEFLTRSANEDYKDNQIGYFKSINAKSVMEGNKEGEGIVTVWITYGEYKEMRSNPDYLFNARKVKGSTEENPIIVSAKYNGAVGGATPIDYDDLDDDPDNPCASAIKLDKFNRFYNSKMGCQWSFNSWKQYLQGLANSTCSSYSIWKHVCCNNVNYGYIMVFPPNPCYPDPNFETGKVVTGKWIAYKSEEAHN